MSMPTAAIDILGVPDWLGSTERTGVELGPAALARHLRAGVLSGGAVAREVQIDLPEPDPAHLTGAYGTARFLPEVVEGCRRVRDAVAETLAAGRLPLVLMGNDSLMVGVLAAVAERFGNGYGLAWFDAHGDINTPETSPSGRLYGMPLAHALGLGRPELSRLGGVSPACRPDRVALLGARALDPGEVDTIRRLGIVHVTTGALNAGPVGLPARAARAVLAADAPGVFLHVDLDVLDPGESPGVSMHEPDGLAFARLDALVAALLGRGGRLLGMSISEYNPSADPEGVTAGLAHRLVERVAGALHPDALPADPL